MRTYLTKIFLLFIGIMLMMSMTVMADDLDGNLTEAPAHNPPLGFNTASAVTDTDNGDGTWTFRMRIDEHSTSPHYLGPWYDHGFEIYSWYNGDYGWLHTFSHWNDPNLNIISAKLIIHAWDIDSEPSHGYYGEYDGVYVDGNLLSPGYLQGFNQQWSTTTFDLPISTILDDGNINVFLDIDMHHTSYNWATTLDFSFLDITYSTIVNDPPYQPEVSWGYLADIDCVTKEECITYGEGLLVEIVGPTPADPDGDAVTYEYRWFVDIGTGGFIDDEFAGRGNHLGNTVPAADILPNDIWQVQIIPVDEHGAIGEQTTVIFPAFCTVDCPFGCIEGYVTANCPTPGTALYGIDVDVFEVSTGELFAFTTTDINGHYEICDIPVEDYNVLVVTPLGYSANPDELAITVVGNDTVTASFDLTCQIGVASPRTIGFWKHQVGVHTGTIGKNPKAQVTDIELCSYLDMIENHFNSNTVNQVIVYNPPVGSDCLDKFMVAKELLNLKGAVAMITRARQQLMALLLNVSAGYMHQANIVSADGATLSQAITFCDNTIDDPNGDYELAKTIADLINNNDMVPAGMIPLSTVNITYKLGNLPLEFTIGQNYPNPFNPSTVINFSLPEAVHVLIEVLNITGQRVAVLEDRFYDAGHHSVLWDSQNSGVASGIFLYRIQAGDFAETKKMVLLK